MHQSAPNNVLSSSKSYAKFSGAPLKLNPTNNPMRTPTGVLPVLRHNKTTLTKFDEISAHLRKHVIYLHHIHQLLNEINLFCFTNVHLFQNFSADYELSPKQCAEVVAYTQLVKDKLVPALEFVWWVDSKNFVEFSRPTYANCLPFPLNVSIKAPISWFVVGLNHPICLFPTIFQFYYPGQYENRAKELIAALYKEEEDYEVIETAVRFNTTFKNCIYEVIIFHCRYTSKRWNASPCCL